MELYAELEYYTEINVHIVKNLLFDNFCLRYVMNLGDLKPTVQYYIYLFSAFIL